MIWLNIKKSSVSCHVPLQSRCACVNIIVFQEKPPSLRQNSTRDVNIPMLICPPAAAEVNTEHMETWSHFPVIDKNFSTRPKTQQ